MTNVWHFIKWQVSKWTLTDYLWFLACGLIGGGLEKRETVFYAGVTLAMIMVMYGLLKIQWDQWKRERKDLLETIKGDK